jgi:hypothetical protein
MTEKTEKRCREKALGRAMRVLEGLWKALEIPGAPPLEAAEGLVCKRKGQVWVWPSYGRGEAVIELGFPARPLRFPTPIPSFPQVRLTGDAKGNVEVEVEDIFAREGRAFTTFDIWRVEKKVEVARTFRPLFEALGLGDLKNALEALAGLRDGEARMEGEYLLAREWRTFILKRGSLLGDFGLDKAFLVGEGARLFFPGGVELALRGGGFGDGLVGLAGLEIRWGEERVRFEAGLRWVKARANGDDPVGELVRKRVARELRNPDFRPSPRMRALLEALAGRKRPLEALKREDFSRKALLSALSRF